MSSARKKWFFLLSHLDALHFFLLRISRTMLNRSGKREQPCWGFCQELFLILSSALSKFTEMITCFSFLLGNKLNYTDFQLASQPCILGIKSHFRHDTLFFLQKKKKVGFNSLKLYLAKIIFRSFKSICSWWILICHFLFL